FFVVRGVGGKALSEVENRFLQRALSKLDERPVLTTIGLRTLFLMSPPLNYALGLSSITFRNYLVGSLLGLIIPVAGLTFLFDWLLAQDVLALTKRVWPWLAVLVAVGLVALTFVRMHRRRRDRDQEEPEIGAPEAPACPPATPESTLA
ncbi:MAG: TVP38/TMEM64 family protein, partial [Planctomycetota bacterium]